MAEQFKMSLPTYFFVLSLLLVDISTDKKNKIQLEFFIWSSIHFSLVCKKLFSKWRHNSIWRLQDFFYFTSTAGVLNYAAFKFLFQNMIY
jgi:hypothetical protein